MLAVVLAAIALQFAASLLVRTVRVRAFLTRQLQGAFGRPVEVREFSASFFPTPQLDAYAISVGEDPAFGNEYFLRADRLSAGLRWSGFLRGRFELGTLQLDGPSLVLGPDTTVVVPPGAHAEIDGARNVRLVPPAYQE